MNDFFPLSIALLFVVVAFVWAMRNGVLKLLNSGAAAAAALAVFLGFVNFLPLLGDQLMDIQLTWKPLLGGAAVLALVVYVIAMLIFGVVFRWLFNSDGMFHSLVEGIPGGVLSFFPSMVVVFFMFFCFRVAGTVQELNYTASLSQVGIVQRGGNIPAYPVSAGWRNGIESVPLVAPILDLFDPFSNRRNRNVAALVMIEGSDALHSFAERQKETAVLIVNPGIEALSGDAEVYAALVKQDRIGLVLNAELRRFASTPELLGDLAEMNLRQVLEDFVKSLKPETISIPEI